MTLLFSKRWSQWQKRLNYTSRNTYSVNTNDIRFKWEKGKNQENRRKHGVSFEGTTGTGGDPMREHYDFGKMKGEKNPYIKTLKQPITIRLDKATVAYFKALASELGMPYQNLINLYLRECALNRKKLQLKWAS